MLIRFSLILFLLVGCSKPMNFGHFENSIKVEWVRGDESERRMKLLEDFVYVDPSGKQWIAPKGYETDGASIPKVFWSIVGGPFDGQYREAAVIHDQYCDIKTEPWKDVHRIFYYANRASGISETKAKILYAAVRVGGPKWGSDHSNCYSCHDIDPHYKQDRQHRVVNIPEITSADANKIVDWVTEKNPTIEDIDKFIEITYPKSTFFTH
ncbi:DUF1353 domain-containing protein [Methylomonas sp. CM2]|uniref:DUF1353 domain-containing protein n=1 Tax=Methylomonas sp. CM2 TaxID=3417647 RepID=UPI003CFAE7E9